MAWRALRWLAGWVAFAAAGLLGAALAQPAVQPVPPLTARVVDLTGTLDATQRQRLEDKLAGFEQAAGTQIAILLVATTAPEDMASYANRVGNAWKIGRKQVGDGLLLVVAKGDRKVRIEVAKALEGAVPDLAARQVIDEAITPRFRQGDFAGGLEAATDQLMARVRGEALPAPAQAPSGADEDGRTGSIGLLFLCLFFAVPLGGALLCGLLGPKLGPLLTGGGAGALAFFITSSLSLAAMAALFAWLYAFYGSEGASPGTPSRGSSSGSGGWSSSSDGGGGFSSGGGGDFGGGGASGDW